MNEALAYVHQRKQFGKSIMSFQGIQWMFADMIDRGITHDIGHLSAMAKVFASDVAMKVATDAVQVYGGYGYMTEYPVEKMMRDAKITQIYEGTNQIQRNVIGARLMKEASRLVPWRAASRLPVVRSRRR
jgi:alkylation response protein AidB-like acyl-CoA dehydrogenase